MIEISGRHTAMVSQTIIHIARYSTLSLFVVDISGAI